MLQQEINQKPEVQQKNEFLGEFQVLQKLGTGRTCNVFQCKDSAGKLYALKKFKEPKYMSCDIQNEISVFEALNHENILKLITSQNSDSPFLILELMPNGELFDYVLSANKKFPHSLGRYYFKQLAEGVKHMHSYNYCHRDLKLENCLLDENFELKLSDFGFTCKNMKGSKALDRILGTDGYMSPEMCMHKQYDGFQSDVFALGVVLFILIQGFPPFFKKALGSDPYYKYFVDGRQQIYWKNMQKKFNLSFSDEFIDIINKMIEPNPEKRITLDEVLEHDYLKGDLMSQEDRISYMKTLKQEFSPSYEEEQ